MDVINPEPLGVPRGWNHGMLAPAGGRVLFLAGQTAGPVTDLSTLGFVEQFDQALANAITVVREAGGTPEDIGRMNIYVTDIAAYRSNLKQLGQVYRRHMGRHYPAMVLVAVTALVDPNAMVEIEATAVIREES